MAKMIFEIAFTQHRGRNLSYPKQQDALCNGTKVFQQPDLKAQQCTVESDVLLVAVADGVGSSPKAEQASRLVLDALLAETAKGKAFDLHLVRRLQGLLCDKMANEKTFGSAATLAAAEVREGRCTVINVGDSRVYRVSANNEWRQLSHDHTWINALIDSGEAQAGTSYASFYDALDSCLVADYDETEFAIHRIELPFQTGEALLLCTDGVHDILGDEGLKRLTDPQLTPLAQVNKWRQAVLALGAPDNFSMLLVRRCG